MNGTEEGLLPFVLFILFFFSLLFFSVFLLFFKIIFLFYFNPSFVRPDWWRNFEYILFLFFFQVVREAGLVGKIEL